PGDGKKRVTVFGTTLVGSVGGGVAKIKKYKKTPMVGDGQSLHTTCRCCTQGYLMFINKYVDL
ncbi:hypothetical protein J4U88_03735, partial [Escherichia coli]